MKKSLLLIPSLVALSATPFIGLTSCFESEDDPKPGPTPPEPTPSDWYLDDKYINSLTTNDIGTEKDLEVNGINQSVVLIGIDADVSYNTNKTFHTTWQFKHVLCDGSGYSLATFWNNVNLTQNVCDDYANSSIRKALDNKGEGSIAWYEKGEQNKSKTYQKSVLEMLPKDLQAKLQPVSKYISVYGSGSTPEEQYCHYSTIGDEIFIPSAFEVFGNNTYFGETYRYEAYKNDKVSIVPAKKSQIKGDVGALTEATDIIDAESKSTDPNPISIAGYENTEEHGTGYYLRDLSWYHTWEHDNFGMPFGVSAVAYLSGDDGPAYCAGAHGNGNVFAAPICPCFCL